MRNHPGRRELCKRWGVLQDRSPLGDWLRGMGQRFCILAGFCERARSGRSLVRPWNIAACLSAVTPRRESDLPEQNLARPLA